MKKIILTQIFLIIFFTLNANASLVVRGVDNLGSQLIYDTDYDITWYDYTQSIRYGFGGAKNWAQNLEVTTSEGQIFTEWRLPTAYNQDGSGPEMGYKLQSQHTELGHLYYTELNNIGARDENGRSQPGAGLINTGPFANLTGNYYWTSTAGTENNAARAYHFYMPHGYQGVIAQSTSSRFAIAIVDGDIMATPIPGAVWLLGSGLLGLAGHRIRKKECNNTTIL